MRRNGLLTVIGGIFAAGVLIHYWWVVAILVVILVLADREKKNRVERSARPQAHYSNRR